MVTGECLCGRAGWRLDGDPGSITACNCTLCRRYGALWAYGIEGDNAELFGETRTFMRAKPDPALEIHFCAHCAAVVGYRSLRLEADGGRKLGLNVRLADPEAVADLEIDHFDGLDSFDDLPRDGRRVRDLWF